MRTREECSHDDVHPILGDENWGRCAKCGEEGFPLTDAAAYGPVDCATCHDTGVAPCFPPESVTLKDGRAVDTSSAFASMRCPDCIGHVDAADERA